MVNGQRSAHKGAVVHHLRTSLGTLAVREYPAHEHGMGTALLWHSTFADSRSWSGVAPALARHRRLLIVDGPGCGASSALTRVSNIPEGGEAAVQILNHLGVDQVDWVGNAWGGHTGLQVAATAPERVRSLVTISTPVDALPEHERRRIALLARVLRVVGPVRPLRDAVAAVQLVDPHGPSRPTLDTAMRTPSRRSLATTVESFVVRRADLWWALPHITAPTLVVATDQREDFTPTHAEAAARTMPHGRWAVLPGSRVLAPLEQPEATANLVITFWRSLTDRRETIAGT